MFIVYSKPNCPFCDQAKNLLRAQNIEYREIRFDVGQPKVEGAEYVNVVEFKAKYPDAKTAPQIFMEEGENLVHVGGFSELRARLS